jgi:glycosyltransferase involved in cell wall biosynthesis
MGEPLVSVCVITYQHVNYIRTCLNAILMQETTFPFEIIIGEDESKDGTREVCIEYAEKYPNKISLFLRSRKDVIYLNGSPNGRYNFIECIRSSKGKYIAICEGDDYWTDPNKLQKQVEFLESHSEYVGCFHNTEERYEDDSGKASFLYCNFPESKNISFTDLSIGNLIPTCSVIFKKRLFGDFPEWYQNITMGDWPLHLLNAQFGDYWYMPKIMGVHRLHNKSLWMLQDSKLIKKFTIDAYDTMIKGFQARSELQGQLIGAKEAFINPPKHRQLNLAKRGINYIKRKMRQ